MNYLSYFNLFQSAMHKEQQKFNMNLALDPAAVTEIDINSSNFDSPYDRLAYIYKYGNINLHFYKECFAQYFSKHKKSPVFLLPEVKLCSLSCGPAMDYLALLLSLHECTDMRPVFDPATFISKSAQWKHTAKFVFEVFETELKKYKLGNSTRQWNPIDSITFIQTNPMTKSNTKTTSHLQTSDVILMLRALNVKASGGSEDNSIVDTLKEIFFSLKPGCMVIFSDTKPSTELVTIALNKIPGDFIFPPEHFQTRSEPFPEALKDIYGCCPVISTRGMFFVWQKSEIKYIEALSPLPLQIGNILPYDNGTPALSSASSLSDYQLPLILKSSKDNILSMGNGFCLNTTLPGTHKNVSLQSETTPMMLSKNMGLSKSDDNLNKVSHSDSVGRQCYVSDKSHDANGKVESSKSESVVSTPTNCKTKKKANSTLSSNKLLPISSGKATKEKFSQTDCPKKTPNDLTLSLASLTDKVQKLVVYFQEQLSEQANCHKAEPLDQKLQGSPYSCCKKMDSSFPAASTSKCISDIKNRVDILNNRECSSTPFQNKMKHCCEEAVRRPCFNQSMLNCCLTSHHFSCCHHNPQYCHKQYHEALFQCSCNRGAANCLQMCTRDSLQTPVRNCSQTCSANTGKKNCTESSLCPESENNPHLIGSNLVIPLQNMDSEKISQLISAINSQSKDN